MTLYANHVRSNNKQNEYIKDTTETQDTIQMGVHGKIPSISSKS